MDRDRGEQIERKSQIGEYSTYVCTLNTGSVRGMYREVRIRSEEQNGGLDYNS
jgi:hypothetical protein